ncbi:AAA family ATPase [Desulfobacterales bacterium HSG2]|nr:AAA family ATPase [Desulfobacterales bacterium HSG2]
MNPGDEVLNKKYTLYENLPTGGAAYERWEAFDEFGGPVLVKAWPFGQEKASQASGNPIQLCKTGKAAIDCGGESGIPSPSMWLKPYRTRRRICAPVLSCTITRRMLISQWVTGKKSNRVSQNKSGKPWKAWGVKLYDQRWLPSFAVQDSSHAMIVGFNWLSSCPTQKSSSLTTEIGIEIQGGDLVPRLLAGMEIPEEREASPKLPCAYVSSFFIKGLRSVNEVNWGLGDTDDAPGWHVLIGDNGSGKSTLLRALALALMGKRHSHQLKTEWMNWLCDGETEAQVNVNLLHGNIQEKLGSSTIHLKWRLESDGLVQLEHGCDEEACVDVISMGYGALRRFSGGSEKYENKYGSQKAIARHISLFDYQALNEGLAWLIRLQHHALRGDSERSVLLARVKRLINECNLFPTKVRLAEISPDGLNFSDDQEKKFTFTDLSEGYQAILGMTIDIIRNLSESFGPSQLFDTENPEIVIAPAVVLIDEVDAHLHPTWQQSIGPWLIKHFPNIQFIVGTHSPLICQAADQGTVFRLPGTAVYSEEERETAQAELLRGKDRDRLIYGNMVEAYGSKAFGQIQRSMKGTQKLNRLATLNLRELEHGLSEEEKREQTSLRSIFPTNAYIQAQE